MEVYKKYLTESDLPAVAYVQFGWDCSKGLEWDEYAVKAVLRWGKLDTQVGWKVDCHDADGAYYGRVMESRTGLIVEKLLPEAISDCELTEEDVHSIGLKVVPSIFPAKVNHPPYCYTQAKIEPIGTSEDLEEAVEYMRVMVATGSKALTRIRQRKDRYPPRDT